MKCPFCDVTMEQYDEFYNITPYRIGKLRGLFCPLCEYEVPVVIRELEENGHKIIIETRRFYNRKKSYREFIIRIDGKTFASKLSYYDLPIADARLEAYIMGK